MCMQKWKKWLQSYKHAWVLTYFIIYMVWFEYLERRTDVTFYPMHMQLDDAIPFCEYFIIPYLLWFLLIGVTILYFFFTDVTSFYKCCTLLFTGMTICLLIYTFFPNEQNLRPATFAHTNICTELVQWIYATDTNTNVCPSIHVLNSIGIFMAICESKPLRKHKWILIFSGLLSLSICMSTVFLKQHSLVDVLCGVGLSIALYAFVYRINYPRLLANLNGLSKNKVDKSTFTS